MKPKLRYIMAITMVNQTEETPKFRPFVKIVFAEDESLALAAFQDAFTKSSFYRNDWEVTGEIECILDEDFRGCPPPLKVIKGGKK